MPQLSHESAEAVVPSFSHWRAESGATFPTAVEQARLQRLRRSLAPLAHLFRDRDVLDFGASSALSTCVIHVLGAKSVCGTEPDGDSVRRGNQTLLRLGQAPTIMQTGYKPGLPFADESFDVVLANAVLEHIPQPRGAYIRELWRVLRRGGHLIINETPNKYLPFDFHTTKLPLINWLPSRIAFTISHALGRLDRMNDPWEASGWRGLGFYELVAPIAHWELVPECSKRRHRMLTRLGVPASMLDPYPVWILRKHASGADLNLTSPQINRGWMTKYFVNTSPQPNGDHEVHTESCPHLPADPAYIGIFSSCEDAVQRAGMLYLRVNGCFWCARACHTS